MVNKIFFGKNVELIRINEQLKDRMSTKTFFQWIVSILVYKEHFFNYLKIFFGLDPFKFKVYLKTYS